MEMTTLECLKLFALMSSPLVFSLIVGGVWEGIEGKMEKRKRKR